MGVLVGLQTSFGGSPSDLKKREELLKFKKSPAKKKVFLGNFPPPQTNKWRVCLFSGNKQLVIWGIHDFENPYFVPWTGT